jgi:O-methyltransferase
MPDATTEDVTHHDQGAGQVRERLLDDQGKWNFASIEEVRSNLLSTGFPEDRLVLVKGKVEDTIPGTIMDAISILRLDTDFYDSTYHEFQQLFPRLSRRGVLIVDDYDYWKGARLATDQYFSENGIQLLLQRMDVGRIGVKL